jgi:putative endonuclease
MDMTKQYYVYIMTNKYNTVLYTGMTIDLKQRIFTHREGLVEGFTKRYQINKFIYYEVVEDLDSALYREKEIKNYSRVKKIDLVSSLNPHWIDLFGKIQD